MLGTMQVPPMSGTRPDDLRMGNLWRFPLVQWIGLQLCLGIPTLYQLTAPGSRAQLGKFELFGYLVSMFQIICLALRVAGWLGLELDPLKRHPFFHLAHHRLVLSSRSFRSSCTFTSRQTSPGSDLVTGEFAAWNSYPPVC